MINWGRETARSLALHNAHIVMANRNVEQSEALRQEIISLKVSHMLELFLKIMWLKSFNWT
jgi:NADP-dependent 3-hydroxy acid dehydrogenase YdfG